MATSVSDVISQAALFIDDVRLTELLEVSPAQYYRKMSAYVQAAMPLLNRPPELFTYINSGYTASTVDSSEWTSTSESLEEETTVETGITGYELCSVVQRSSDGLYATAYTDFTYDSETGEVTFAVQSEEDVEYEIDFYNDGSFNDLTVTMMRLFSLAILTVWNDRFNNDWLSMHMKIKDSSFDTVNESNYIEKMTLRTKELKQELSSELHKYEQDVAYNRIVPSSWKTSSSALI